VARRVRGPKGRGHQSLPKIRVSDPHSFHADPDRRLEKFADADPDPGCEKFADLDPGLNFYKKFEFINVKKEKN